MLEGMFVEKRLCAIQEASLIGPRLQILSVQGLHKQFLEGKSMLRMLFNRVLAIQQIPQIAAIE